MLLSRSASGTSPDATRRARLSTTALPPAALSVTRSGLLRLARASTRRVRRTPSAWSSDEGAAPRAALVRSCVYAASAPARVDGEAFAPALGCVAAAGDATNESRMPKSARFVRMLDRLVDFISKVLR